MQSFQHVRNKDKGNKLIKNLISNISPHQFQNKERIPGNPIICPWPNNSKNNEEQNINTGLNHQQNPNKNQDVHNDRTKIENEILQNRFIMARKQMGIYIK